MVALISEDYRQEQERLHENPNYGVASVGFAPQVSQIINAAGVTDLLDYGAGKGRLAMSLRPDHEVAVRHYDPAIPEWSDTPEPAQMVCCIDVLEHIEPDLLDNVLDDLKRVTKNIGFFSVHTGPAVKVLSDGRNAHLIQELPSWWLPKFMERFDLRAFNATKNGFFVVVNGA